MTKSTSVDFAKVLADPTRQTIMQLCSSQWISVNDIVAQLNIAQPSVSYHLAILRGAGLVNVRQQGRQSFYLLNQDKFVDCCGQLMIDFAPEQIATKQLKKFTQTEE